MLKAVIDTSVFVSGLISSNGSPRLVITAMNDSMFIPVISESTLTELDEVLTRIKFHHMINKDEASALIENLNRHAVIVKPSITFTGRSLDPKDDKFLEAAFAARANCIVSLDAHLFKLKTFENIPIIKPKDFLIKLRHK